MSTIKKMIVFVWAVFFAQVSFAQSPDQVQQILKFEKTSKVVDGKEVYLIRILSINESDEQKIKLGEIKTNGLPVSIKAHYKNDTLVVSWREHDLVNRQLREKSCELKKECIPVEKTIEEKESYCAFLQKLINKIERDDEIVVLYSQRSQSIRVGSNLEAGCE